MANLIFDQAERKPLTDELRTRLAARSSVLRLSGLVPYFASLERDPVHPSTYYLAVDGEAGQPLLLHTALANAPTSSLFPKPLLIGRMPRAGGPEMVINCLPFGPADREAIEKFAAQTDQRLLPKPLGSRPSIVVESARPEVDFPVALEAFRALAKRGGKNLAALAGGPEAWPCALWAAIRTGWRDGYSIGAAISLDDDWKESVRRAAGCTRFTVALGTGDPMAGLQAAAAAHEFIRQTRSARKAGRSFDFELDLRGSAADPRFSLGWMKEHGRPVQLLASDWPGDGLAELAAAALQFGCTLSVAAGAAEDADTLAVIGRATLGRVSYRLSAATADLPAAIQHAAAHLFG